MASCPVEEKEIDSCIKEVGFVLYHWMGLQVGQYKYEAQSCIQYEIFYHDQVMKAVDKDGDGEISKEEFVTHAFESDVIRNILQSTSTSIIP